MHSRPRRETEPSFWDRPKPTHDWHWFLGRLGSTLIVAGLLVFTFVGYQLWGTGIEAAQSQQRLESEFTDIADSPPPESGDVLPERDPIVVSEGDPIALIDIPKIGLSRYVVAGVETADLKKGPGHYPKTPFPGESGNAAIAGHRTTYGEPFRRIDELSVGDPIIVTDLLGRRFTYRVTGQSIVSPRDSWVVDTVDPMAATLTLTTCHPEFSAKQRLIVFADLDTSVSDVAEFSAATYDSRRSAADETGPDAAQGDRDDSSVVDTSDVDSALLTPQQSDSFDADVFDKGWFSDTAAIPHVVGWILLEVLVVAIAWRIARRVRHRGIGFALGVVPFFFVLYFVFQNINRLLPPNL